MAGQLSGMSLLRTAKDCTSCPATYAAKVTWIRVDLEKELAQGPSFTCPCCGTQVTLTASYQVPWHVDGPQSACRTVGHCVSTDNRSSRDPHRR